MNYNRAQAFALIRSVVLIAGATTLGYLAYAFGLLQLPFAYDVTYLTWVIAAVGIAGTVLALGAKWVGINSKRYVYGTDTTFDYLMITAVELGLLGTAIGFVVGLFDMREGLEFASDTERLELVVAVMGGVLVALFTTIAGIIVAMWLRLLQFELDYSIERVLEAE